MDWSEEQAAESDSQLTLDEDLTQDVLSLRAALASDGYSSSSEESTSDHDSQGGADLVHWPPILYLTLRLY